ncbi:MAG: hypothetical protein QM767_15165 [Anaeromyxobacter sp.]
MPLASPTLTPQGSAASLARRGLSAVLRWRLRRVLPGLVPARAIDAAHFAPVLLHASFQQGTLRAEAPGVAGLRYRRRWASLARAFELPPPWRAQRNPPMVEAVLAVPGGPGLDLYAVTSPGLARGDLGWVEERAALAESVLAGAGVALHVIEPAELERAPMLAHRLVLWGAVAGGRLGGTAWSALEAGGRRPVLPAHAVALAAGAPTPLCALALTLLPEHPAPPPLEATHRLLRTGTPVPRLAEPGFLAVQWAGTAAPAHAAALGRVLALAEEPGTAQLAEVLGLAAALSVPLARAVRSRGEGLDARARAAWRERLGPDLPRALAPALAACLAGGERLETGLHSVGRQTEVRLAGGPALGRGGTPVQARVRALSVLAGAALEPLLAHAEPPWDAVASRLVQAREGRSLLLVVEPATPAGPPYDPLNRGPERALAFPGALAVRLAPGRRPTARVLTAPEVIERLVTEARQTRVEVLGARSEAQPVAARLAQFAALLREAGDSPVALEAGGRVLLVEGPRVRRLTLDRLASRPRRFRPDPDAPDLVLAPGERRPSGLGGSAVVTCRAHALDASRAAVVYADQAGAYLREVVFLSDLEAHLREGRDLLQAADPRAILAIHLADELELAIRRAGPPGTPLPLSVRARLPFDLQIEVGGEWYGGSTGRSWRAASLAFLGRWPRGAEARISVAGVNAVARGRRQGGLLALYTRALAIRRLRTHLVRTLRAYQAPRPRRSGG